MSGISVGTEISAPDGYLNLVKGDTYYFLRSSPITGLVTLLQLVERETKAAVYASETRPNRNVTLIPLPLILAMARADFERGVMRTLITAKQAERGLPPWQQGLEGLNLDVVDSLRRKPARLHADRVDDKLQAIYPLVQRFDEILDSPDPDLAINRHTRSLGKRFNETRVRLWFYTYLVFGRQRAVLHYAVHKIGRWNRLEKASVVKRGRASAKGRGHGHNTTAEMLEKLVKGYRRECGLGVRLSDIYIRVMKKDFGCQSRWVSEGKKKRLDIYHPQGRAFPTMKTFVYHVLKVIGLRKVQTTLYGKVRARSKLLPVRGSFTESSWNLMQRVEADAFAIEELPRGYVEGSSLPPLYVSTRRDTASGMKTGIGFSQGSERASSYRMAKFCEAIPKERFCMLFGVKIRPQQWPSEGASPADITDRGPGATAGAQSRDEDYRQVVRETAPSHAGQSKAVIESSNPKSASNAEAPNFVKSDLHSIELARKAIWDLLRFNESCNVGDRIPPDLADHVSRPTPNGLWEALDKLGRNDAVQIPFEDAVRAYLDLVPAKLTRAGVVLAGRNYFSLGPEFLQARESVTGDQEVDIKVYVLEACVRHIWFDWKQRLIELDVRYPIPVDSVVKYMSLAEAEQYHKYAKDRDREHIEHRRAAQLETEQEYEAQTGLDWNSGKRVNGRPKRGGRTAKQEAGEAKHATSGTGAA
jgi:hypothetical protein